MAVIGNAQTVGAGSAIGISIPEPTLNRLIIPTASVYPVRSEFIHLQAESAGVTVGEGELLSIFAEATGEFITVAKVVEDRNLSTSTPRVVKIRPLDKELPGVTKRVQYYNKYTHIVGVPDLNISFNKGVITVNDLDDWDAVRKIPGMVNATVNLGNIQIVQDSPGQRVLRKYHDENIADPLFFEIVYRNGMQFWFCGNTGGAMGMNSSSSDTIIEGSATVEVRGKVTTKFVTG